MPSIIAEYLELPEQKQFTGHCFQWSSASLLLESGTNILLIKKSIIETESYINQFVAQNRILPKELSLQFKYLLYIIVMMKSSRFI